MPIKRKNKSLKGGTGTIHHSNSVISPLKALQNVGDVAILVPIPECNPPLEGDKLHNYFIKSSHNSYLPTHQHSKPNMCTVNKYFFDNENICQYGGCIEIDITAQGLTASSELQVGHCLKPTRKDLSWPEKMATRKLETHTQSTQDCPEEYILLKEW